MNIPKIISFIKTDIWRIRLEDLPRQKSFFIKQLRIFLLAFRGFTEDKCQLRASALTYYSLLSIVPVIALIFAIGKGFGLEKMLEKQLSSMLKGQQEVMQQVLTFANSLLENTRGDVIAGIGVVLLLYSVMRVLSNIESSFNDIWQIKKARSFMRKFSDYLSIMLIAPVLIIMSGSITIFITTQITRITESIELIGFFSPLIFFLLKLLPYCMIWLLFTFIYIVMPNTKVNFKSALIAGIIAGTTFQVVEWAYISFQIGVAKYNAIYGSFAALPLFLIWLQTSWLIVLLGAEISFANQNVNRYEFEIESSQMSASYKRLISLLTTHLVIKKFANGEPPLTIPEISNALKVPVRVVRQVIFELAECNILSETKVEEPKDLAYQPAQSINNLSIGYILDAMDRRGVDNIPVAETKELKTLTASMEAFKNLIDESPANKLLKDV